MEEQNFKPLFLGSIPMWLGSFPLNSIQIWNLQKPFFNQNGRLFNQKI